MAKDERYTHAVDFKGERTKGKQIGTLWCDMDIIEGDVTMRFNFDKMHPLERVDVLNDIIGMLERELEYQTEEFNKYLQSMLKEIVQQH